MGRIGNLLRRIRLPDRAELRERVHDWMRTEGRWYATSAAVHFLGLMCLLLVPAALMKSNSKLGVAPSFESPEMEQLPPVELSHFRMGTPPLDPTELNTETLLMLDPPGHKAQYNDASPIFKEAGGGTPQGNKQLNFGGLGGFNIKAFGEGARVRGRGGVGNGLGTGTHAGFGGAGEGFGGRGSGHRDELLSRFGGTRDTERAVGAALYWLHRHQEGGGNWSLAQFSHHCKDHPCSGVSNLRADSGATALAILCYLAAGQTHKSNGPYRDTIHKGLFWLVKKQTSDGDLAAGGEQPMYSHGLATIALCEAYGMTKDPHLGNPAQAAVAFIERAQNAASGGWRYEPQQFGDTSVFGWQVMALKSAQMAGLAVNSMALEKCEKWLSLVAKGANGGLFSYQQYGSGKDMPSPSMTAVGQLCRQYMGAAADSPAMIEGKELLRANPPLNSESALRDTYYWYYATQVMFNLGGPQWDEWNRAMRHTLLETQCKDGCAAGSWDPERPTLDIWAGKGGRIVTTTLSTLTLEVYYRYLPLYQINHKERAPLAPPAAGEPVMVQNPAQNPATDPHPLEKPADAPAASHGIGL